LAGKWSSNTAARSAVLGVLLRGESGKLISILPALPKKKSWAQKFGEGAKNEINCRGSN